MSSSDRSNNIKDRLEDTKHEAEGSNLTSVDDNIDNIRPQGYEMENEVEKYSQNNDASEEDKQQYQSIKDYEQISDQDALSETSDSKRSLNKDSLKMNKRTQGGDFSDEKSQSDRFERALNNFSEKESNFQSNFKGNENKKIKLESDNDKESKLSQDLKNNDAKSNEFNDLELISEVPPIKVTSIPIFPNVSTKIVTSGFSHVDMYGATDRTSTFANKPYFEVEGGGQFELELSENCIIFHPGSRNLRLGFSNNPIPTQIPHVIARKLKGGKKRGSEAEKKDPEIENIDEERLNEAIGCGEADVLERLQSAKRKPVNNAINQVVNFNSSVQSTQLLDHNDSFKEKWYDISNKPDILIGEDVLNYPEIKKEYCTRFPLKYGKLNTEDYDTLMEVRGDLETLWGKAIEDILKLDRKYFEVFSIGLVIPDAFCPIYLKQAVDVLLTSLGFYSIFIIQESVAATFGAGISQACVVNIGAETTSVTCVEEGACIPKSRISLPYGGDDITKLLYKLLLKSSFPHPDLRLDDFNGFKVIDELKKTLANFNELELAVQLNHFFVPVYNKPTLRYEIKSYDEGFIAPMLLFNPTKMDIDLQDKLKKINQSKPWVKNHVPEWLDNVLHKQYLPGSGHGNKKANVAPNIAQLQGATSTPQSGGPIADDDEGGDIEDDDGLALAAQDDVFNNYHSLLDDTLGLDQAISQSIRVSSLDELTMRRFYSLILVTGGSAHLQALPKILQQKLTEFAPLGSNIEVLVNVRDLDPKVLAWKGASVFSKLDIVEELWMNFKEWEDKGIHVLRDKLLLEWPLPW